MTEHVRLYSHCTMHFHMRLIDRDASLMSLYLLIYNSNYVDNVKECGHYLRIYDSGKCISKKHVLQISFVAEHYLST